MVARFSQWLREHGGPRCDDYDALWQWSISETTGFWEAIWHFFDVQSSTPYECVLANPAMPPSGWFHGAHLNYAEHVLARARPTGPVILALGEDVPPRELTAADLRGQVGALAAALRELGVGRGDAVAAYLPNGPEAVVALLAVTSLGAIWTVCSPDFGLRSVVDRLGQVEPKVLLAVDGYRFGGQEHDRRDVLSELVASLPTVEHAVVARRLRPDAEPSLAVPTLRFEDLVSRPCEPSFDQVPFEHPLWVLFSSGTTGTPKGIVHSHGGVLLEHLKAAGLGLDLGPDDRFFFHTSSSWMSWNFLVSALMQGCTIVLYDGSPTATGTAGLWNLAAASRASLVGLGSAYVTSCMKAEVDVGALPDLRLVIPTGSPLPLAAWSWLHDELGSGVRIDSMCGGTDVCAPLLGGSPWLPVYLGEISGSLLGVHAEAFDATGQPLVDEVGEFVMLTPLPSMPLGFLNDGDGHRYRDAYFTAYPGAWRQGDWITITSRRTVIVWGRSDATLNRGGVRLGSAEIYTVVEGLPEIADSLVVGVELPDGEYYLPLFAVPVDGHRLDDDLRRRIRQALAENLSPRHVPDEIVEVPAVPRTLTGKKLEVPVKRILQGAAPEGVTARGAVDRPDMIDWFVDFADRRTKLVSPAD